MTNAPRSVDEIEVEGIDIRDDGTFPANARPALRYRGALSGGGDRERIAAAFERIFAGNGWTASWRDGVFAHHHYHSTAHEVLGCYSGSARVQLGGPGGPAVGLATGDAVVIPAGVAHRRLSSSEDFAVVGAYAGGRSWDLLRGEPGERPRADHNIAALPDPTTDPLYGRNGPLVVRWSGRERPDVG